MFWYNFSPEPAPLKPILSLYSLLFSFLSLLFLSFFVHLLSCLPPKSVSNPELEVDNIMVASVDAEVPSALTMPALPPWCSLLNTSRIPPKFSFVFNYPKSTCRSVVSPTPKILERWYDHRLVFIPCWYSLILSPSFHPVLVSILRLKVVELDEYA